MSKSQILVVDDDEPLRGMLRAYFEMKGYSVREAATGRVCLEAASPPDAILMDYELPDTDATRLLPEVHAIAPSIPVIVLTGYGTIDLAVQAIKAGAEQFLTKPLAMPVLSKLLENILESRRQKRKQLADVADASLAKTLRDAADNHGNRWKIPAVLTAETVGIFGPEAARINSLTTPHPRRTLEEPIFLTVPEMRIPTTYIACTCPWGGESYIRQTERARRLGWAVRELPTGHLPMITMPEKLGSLLTEAGNQAFSNASQQ